MSTTGRTATARSTGWFPVARATEVGTTPVPVGAGGRAYVVVRLRPGGEVSAFPSRCPHRLVPLAAATVVEGRLQCLYHGWRFDGEGRCVDVPSLGPDGTAPPRADLSVPWAVEERHGWIWLAPERTAVTLPPPPPAGDPLPEPVPDPEPPPGHSSLDRATGYQPVPGPAALGARRAAVGVLAMAMHPCHHLGVSPALPLRARSASVESRFVTIGAQVLQL